MAVQMVIDIAEDEFTFSPGIGGYDDAVGFVEATLDGFEPLESCGVGRVVLVLVLAHLTHDKLKRIGTDGQVFGFIGCKTVGFGHGKGDEMSHRPCNHITVTFQVSVFSGISPYDTGYNSGYRGFLGNNTSNHSWVCF